MTPPVVRIEWVDSASHGEPWDDLGRVKQRMAKYPDALLCFSIGFLVGDTADTVTLAHSYTLHTETGALAEICGGLTIPRCAITKLRKVKAA